MCVLHSFCCQIRPLTVDQTYMEEIDHLLKSKIFQSTKRQIHEFEDICAENQKYFGKGIWKLPYMTGVTNEVLRDAISIAKGRGIYKLPYLIGIVKKLINK